LSPILPLRVVHRAEREIAEAAVWWRTNRPKAPGAFRDELRHAFELIASQPRIGARALNARLASVRRVHLSRIRYYLYYRHSTSKGIIEVLALQHASRGTEPEL
jgi:plasmid stabilization system protein ParE